MVPLFVLSTVKPMRLRSIPSFPATIFLGYWRCRTVVSIAMDYRFMKWYPTVSNSMGLPAGASVSAAMVVFYRVCGIHQHRP